MKFELKKWFKSILSKGNGSIFMKWVKNFLTIAALIVALTEIYDWFTLSNRGSNSEIAKNTQNHSKFTTIFPEDDKNNFNILIVRFEDYINDDTTNCIGSSIQDKIGVIDANEGEHIEIISKYADTISAPRSLREAKNIQEHHNADLIIYGTAKNLIDCHKADVCFRYNIREDLLSSKTPEFGIKRAIHDSKTLLTSPEQIEKDNFEISSLALNKWIIILAELKLNKKNISFNELEKILVDSDTISSERLSKIYLNISKTCTSLNQFECAILGYTKALDLYPKKWCYYNYRGIAYKNSKKYSEAISDYSKAIQLNPKYADAYYNKGRAYKLMGEYDSSILSFKKAIEIDSLDEDYFISLAHTYSKKKDFESAIFSLDKAISINPNDTLAYSYRGVVNRRMGNRESALHDFYLAISLDSTYFQAYNNRGILYKNEKMYDKALVDYNKAVKLDESGESYVYYNRGVLYSILNQNHLALADFNKYLSYEPNDLEGFFERGRVLSKLGRHKSAIKDYQKALELNTPNDDPSLFYKKAISYKELNNYSLAIKNYDSVILLDSSRSKVFFQRGFAHNKSGNKNNALRDFNHAISLDSSLVNAYNTRGVLFLELGNLEHAITDFKSTIALDPYFFYAYVNLFYSYAILKYWYLSIFLILLVIVLFYRRRLKRILRKFKFPTISGQK